MKSANLISLNIKLSSYKSIVDERNANIRSRSSYLEYPNHEHPLLIITTAELGPVRTGRNQIFASSL